MLLLSHFPDMETDEGRLSPLSKITELVNNRVGMLMTAV